MKRTLIALIAAAGLVLAGCSEATEDRDAGAGDNPDSKADATSVLVYRNADDVPNLAFFCTGPFRWVSTLSGGDDGKNKAAGFMRFPEGDSLCDQTGRKPG